MTDQTGVCPDCEYPLFDHLSADEAEAHGIDPGLRDGLGCAVVARAAVSLQPREIDLIERADIEATTRREAALADEAARWAGF